VIWCQRKIVYQQAFLVVRYAMALTILRPIFSRKLKLFFF